MKNKILNAISILLCTVIISAGYTYSYYCGEDVFNIMDSSVSTSLIIVSIYINLSNRN